MAFSTTSLGGVASRGSSVWSALALEILLVAAAVVVVVPWFTAVASHEPRDARFRGEALAVRGLPDPVLPDMCVAYGSLAEPAVADRLCGRSRAASNPPAIERVPFALTSAIARARQAFVAPVQDAQLRIGLLRDQQREGIADVLATGHAIDDATREVEPFIERFEIDAEAGPRALACATDALRAAFNAPAADPVQVTLRANALLLFAGALDGHGAVSALAGAAALPAARASLARCDDASSAAASSALAAVMIDARDARIVAMKDRAMRDLLAHAQWYWAGGIALAYLMLNLTRRVTSPAIALALCVAGWAVAAWLARVPWPFAGKHAFLPGRESASFWSPPALYVWWLLAFAAGLLLLSPWLRSAKRGERPASVVAFPGLVMATGIGWVILLDLSANGHYGNRFLALYHEGHLWLALFAFTAIACIRQPLGRALAWLLSMLDGVLARLTGRVGTFGGATLLLVLALAAVAVIASALANLRQLTSELGRLWLVLGAAWFFFLRGTPLTERLARSGNSVLSLVRYASPLAFVVLVLIAAMLFTHDMGPLLIAGYGAGALVAAALAMWWHQRTSAIVSAYALAAILFVGWIATTTAALFHVAAYDQVAAARLENATAPLASANDHLALVTWFQRSAPPAGYGAGAVPWCGYGTSSGCAGVPAQIQSDYTFTALVATFGWTAAWCMTLGCVLWLYLVVRGHGLATRGEPRLVRAGERMVNDEQALLSWLAVCWVALTLCQLAVTVAGNLAVIPLTGVTYPFVSFGMASLVANAAMLALAANVSDEGTRHA